MRRAPIVLSATAVGLAAVLGFKPREPTLPTGSPASSEVRPTASRPASPPSGIPPSRNTPQSSTDVKTATGDSISTPYGNAQVRVTIADGRITNIEAVHLQGNDPRSVQISSFAEPQLQQRALTKQTAAVDAVTGATFTSTSYESSLQSALDQAGYVAPDGSRASAEIPQA